MKINIKKIVIECFSKYVIKYNLTYKDEFYDHESLWIEYQSKNFIIKIEKYRRDFYIILYKIGFCDDGINLFNLLRYLNINISEFEYYNETFDDIKALNDYYKERLNFISTALFSNFEIIDKFFIEKNYKSNLEKINNYMIKEYPNLFKR
ncbi:MAG TPA: hypothetical protein PLF32_02420 [Bacteroidales bacterium]|jgi:hypothetical protein|nr:hypothetical protein [Bacteroidales bacterium]HOF16647.1 hypothetical protein [Bacteroidales bacterium]HOR81495.1 hypothetical protein [Bacteroidales bacterium]HPJ90670.1 hypothetical protein [Bacteroidales bacterium]